jgi:glycosyltransferase involved in cell wall biosynthesis
MYPKQPFPQVSAIICALNEEKSLPIVLAKIPNWVDEILLVDGHSSDMTVQVAKKLRPDIKVFFQPLKGKGDALRFGFKIASKDIVITLDADGATDPEDMPKFIESLLKGFDFAKGSRFSIELPNKKPSHRVFGNLLIAAVFNVLYKTNFTDLCSGYNAFWRKELRRVNLNSNDCFEDEPLLISRAKNAGLKIAEVGHIDLGRIGGESKSPSWRQGFKAIRTITRERVSRD